MNAEECKSLLRRVRKAQFELRAKEEELEIYKSDCYTLTAVDYGKDKLSGGVIHDTSDVIAKLMQLRDAVNSQWNILMNLRLDVNICINNMVDPEYRALLTQRYILAKSWKEVAKAMMVSEDHAKGYKHNNAIREFINANKS